MNCRCNSPVAVICINQQMIKQEINRKDQQCSNNLNNTSRSPLRRTIRYHILHLSHLEHHLLNLKSVLAKMLRFTKINSMIESPIAAQWKLSVIIAKQILIQVSNNQQRAFHKLKVSNRRRKQVVYCYYPIKALIDLIVIMLVMIVLITCRLLA